MPGESVTAAEIRFRAERRLGEMLIENGPKPGGDRQSIIAKSEDAPILSDMGISYDLSSRARALASVSEGGFERESQ